MNLWQFSLQNPCWNNICVLPPGLRKVLGVLLEYLDTGAGSSAFVIGFIEVPVQHGLDLYLVHTDSMITLASYIITDGAPFALWSPSVAALKDYTRYELIISGLPASDPLTIKVTP